MARQKKYRVVTAEIFGNWKNDPVTLKLFDTMRTEMNAMMEGLVNSNFTNEDEVKGRCRAIGNLLNIRYEDLYNEASPE